MHSPASHPGVSEPRTKEEWKGYVLAPEPAQLVLPSWKEYQAMDEMARYRFNRDRDDQHSALVLAWTPRIAHFDEQVSLRLRANKKAPAGAKPCMLISGPGTVGKSTMVKMIARKYELGLRRFEPELFEDRPGNDFVPVVYLTLDDNITPEKFSKALARYLHVPVSGDQSDVDDRGLDMLKSTGVRLLVIDDAHFLDCTRRDGIAANNHVKFLAGCSGVTIIGTGVELQDSALLDEGTGDPRKEADGRPVQPAPGHPVHRRHREGCQRVDRSGAGPGTGTGPLPPRAGQPGPPPLALPPRAHPGPDGPPCRHHQAVRLPGHQPRRRYHRNLIT